MHLYANVRYIGSSLVLSVFIVEYVTGLAIGTM